MTEPRLKTDLWIRSQIRLCDIRSIPAVVARRGDGDAGQVLIKRNRTDGTSEVFARAKSIDSVSGWRCVTGSVPVGEDAARAVIEREVGFDPDLWVLEIEDRDEDYELDGPIVA